MKILNNILSCCSIFNQYMFSHEADDELNELRNAFVVKCIFTKLNNFIKS